MKVGQWLATVGGVWLMAAPAVFAYAGTPAGDLHRTVGPLIAACGTVALWSVTRAVRWVNLVLVVPLAVGTVALSPPTEPVLVAVATGLVIGAATPFGGRDRRRFGGGWAALRSEDYAAPP